MQLFNLHLPVMTEKLEVLISGPFSLFADSFHRHSLSASNNPIGADNHLIPVWEISDPASRYNC
jgi:hypothetical protein